MINTALNNFGTKTQKLFFRLFENFVLFEEQTANTTPQILRSRTCDNTSSHDAIFILKYFSASISQVLDESIFGKGTLLHNNIPLKDESGFAKQKSVFCFSKLSKKPGHLTMTKYVENSSNSINLN